MGRYFPTRRRLGPTLTYYEDALHGFQCRYRWVSGGLFQGVGFRGLIYGGVSGGGLQVGRGATVISGAFGDPK